MQSHTKEILVNLMASAALLSMQPVSLYIMHDDLFCCCCCIKACIMFTFVQYFYYHSEGDYQTAVRGICALILRQHFAYVTKQCRRSTVLGAIHYRGKQAEP